jgi:hypothetical protein
MDIFIHREEEELYWHAGCKVRWWNTKFSLAEYSFCGSVFLGPADYDLYLRENYGDWRKPVPEFDHVFDTPNSVTSNHGEVVVHCLRSMYFRGHSPADNKHDRDESENPALQVALMGRDIRKISDMGGLGSIPGDPRPVMK